MTLTKEELNHLATFKTSTSLKIDIGGHGFDNLFVDHYSNLTGCNVVSAETYKTDPVWSQIRKETIKGNYDLTKNPDIPVVPGFHLIHSPHGSQAFPDAMPYYRGKAMPFEFKSGKQDMNRFNDVPAKPGAIYFTNQYTKERISFTLGDDLTNPRVQAKNKIAKEWREELQKRLNELYNEGEEEDSVHSCYARLMFGSRDTIFKDDAKRLKREERAINQYELFLQGKVSITYD